MAGRVDAGVEVDVGGGLFSETTDFVEAAEGEQFALVHEVVWYGTARGFEFHADSCYGCCWRL